MAILANGYREIIGGVYQGYGATVENNSMTSARLANFARTGAKRNITAGQGITSGLVSIPSGNRHPNVWMMPQKPGALASRNDIIGSGEIALTMVSGKNAEAALSGSGDLAGVAQLIISMVAALTGSGTISNASAVAFLQLAASLAGAGDLDGALGALASAAAALSGSGAVTSTIRATGALAADITVSGDVLTSTTVGPAVWRSIIEAGFTAEEILRIIAAQAAGAATGLEGTNPQFTGLDGTTIRIDGAYSGGTRSIDNLDGS
jgi:hypothetical protein